MLTSAELDTLLGGYCSEDLVAAGLMANSGFYRLPYFGIGRALRPDMRQVALGGFEGIMEERGQAPSRASRSASW